MKPSRLNLSQWVLFIGLALDFYMAGIVWLTQVSCYPLWAYVGAADYPAYHIAWWHSIWTVIFIPGGLVTAGAIAMLWFRPPGVPAWAIKASILLQFLIYGLTAVWWGRLMAEMEQVSGPIYGPLYHQLVLSHWLRVALVTAHASLQLWMVIKGYLVVGEKTLSNETIPSPPNIPTLSSSSAAPQ